MRLCWIDVYIGPPGVINHDAGIQFIAKVFETNAHLLKIDTKSVPIEAPNTMSLVKRYHTPVTRASKIIKPEAPDLSDDEALQMSVNSINDSVCPDGLIPTLFMYSAVSRLGIPNDSPSPNKYRHAAALQKATKEMSRHCARRQINDAVQTRNGPDTTDIHNARLDSHLLSYRPEKTVGTAPFVF